MAKDRLKPPGLFAAVWDDLLSPFVQKWQEKAGDLVGSAEVGCLEASLVAEDGVDLEIVPELVDGKKHVPVGRVSSELWEAAHSEFDPPEIASFISQADRHFADV